MMLLLLENVCPLSMMAMVFDNAGAGGGGGGGADAWSLAATQEPIRKKQLFFTWNLQCTVAFKKKI